MFHSGRVDPSPCRILTFECICFTKRPREGVGLLEPLLAESSVISVSDVIRRIKTMLDHSPELNDVWVKGEISNLRCPASGHRYFTLKDETARMRCVLFRGKGQRLQFDLADGLTVIVRGAVSMYEAAGDIQFYVEEMLPAGQGALHLAFEQLKERLQKEGLFDQKRPLPFFPRRVGVITSRTGAAVQDMLSVLRRRNPTVHVLLIPAMVQGEAAPASICRAFELASQQEDLDVILFGRGGGSLEELWAFNDEQVARAIYQSPVPTISAVGHETDFTIADFVADCRAPTPSVAAELAVPEWRMLKETVDDLRHRNREALMRRIDHLRQRLKLLTESAALTQPDYRIKQAYQRVDDLIEQAEHRITVLIEERRNRLGIAVGKLESLSPLATLSRGYAICSREDTGEVVRDASSVAPGDRLRVRVAKGEIFCHVVRERGRRGAGNDSRKGEERKPSERQLGAQMQLPIG